MTTAMKTEHTATPWSIRPQELDDWGIIRGANGKVSCLARNPEYLDDDALNEHRKNKTDPTQANAALIVRAVNSFEAMKEALEFTEKSEIDHANCDDCDGEIEAEQCGTCFPLADKARIARRAALKLANGE